LPQYCVAIEQAGGDPVAIALELPSEEIACMAAACDAVLLPGSRADVNPERYGAERDPRTQAGDPLRENADELLLQDAYNLRKPIFAICYGVQSLNVWRSGTLVQHLEGGVSHAGTGGQPAPAHHVQIAPGSLLADITTRAIGAARPGAGISDVSGSPTLPRENSGLLLTVNSSHHQAVALAGDGLRVVAKCPGDGLIEALEGTPTGHWVLGVQWHPERMSDTNSQLLFRAFVEAAIKSGHR
jgi:putative glutamine amidotransferase